jgi:heme/copper-type cytochrome/quinol oxidase subunit 2
VAGWIARLRGLPSGQIGRVTYGTSLFLIAAGAILRYAVTTTVSGIDLQVVGLVLMIVGIVGLVLSLLWLGLWSHRREAPPVEREVRDRDLRY